MRYVSAECTAEHAGDHITIRRLTTGAEIRIDLPAYHEPGAAMIMLELNADQRLALDLPACEALTGGTALCLAVPELGVVPSAPTCWDELLAAELAPLAYLGVFVAGSPAAVEALSERR